MNKILVCGPWVGEFGWEIVWQGLCREKAKQYDKIFVCTYGSSFGMYSDFSKNWIKHDWNSEPICYFLIDKTNLNLDKWKSYIISELGNVDFFTPFDGVFNYNNDPNNTVLHEKDHRENGDWNFKNVPPLKNYDIIIHARNREHSTGRNWSIEFWNDLVIKLSKLNLTIGAIGTKVFIPGNVDNLTQLPIKETMSLISGSKIMIGPSSGPMVLAMSLKTPILTWGYSENKDPTIKRRYEKFWNFHNSPVKYFGISDYLPNVNQIMEAFHEFWNRLHR
jgi:hypothetical protein